jgi:hypothetical protein
MNDHKTHPNHAHLHQPGCGHLAVAHDGHTDYLLDGHLHHMHGDHVDECVIAVGGDPRAQRVASRLPCGGVTTADHERSQHRHRDGGRDHVRRADPAVASDAPPGPRPPVGIAVPTTVALPKR